MNPYHKPIKRLKRTWSKHYGGIFDYDLKKERLEEVLRELEDPTIWNDQSRAQAMAKEKGELENVLNVLDRLSTQL
ncbi:peptide chain release factor 2, partial [Yersinia pestis]